MTNSEETLLKEGSRVWVFDPTKGPRARSGKILGYSINFPKYMQIFGMQEEIEYYVDFGNSQNWISSCQIKGF